jgi:hypothetical protein
MKDVVIPNLVCLFYHSLLMPCNPSTAIPG